MILVKTSLEFDEGQEEVWEDETGAESDGQGQGHHVKVQGDVLPAVGHYLDGERQSDA